MKAESCQRQVEITAQPLESCGGRHTQRSLEERSEISATDFSARVEVNKNVPVPVTNIFQF